MQHTTNTSKRHLQFAVVLLALIAFGILEPATANAQQVSTQVSSRETYVGAPIVLQLRIQDAQDYSLPGAFEIDGCDVQAAGRPSQSSQIRIYNGNRSESRSVTMRYQITPRRNGTFEIPVLEIEVDGKTRKTQPIQFVATKSETGDLLFVEIQGKEKSVFVGEPLELALKIWIKPFQDRQNNIKLNESHMWQMLADATNWGPFLDQIQELADNRQRPSGNPVLRDNGQGDSREYFLYELEATVYPTKPGNIDGDDVQVVVDYPLELGRSRDPFESLLGGSPFGRRLTVTKSRPIVANAKVDSTTVLPIPAEGKPIDYRGAVGRYRIITQTESKTVDAGDPVTLQIGIVGDGPMDLVQAPPLADLSQLTAQFKVEDQSLAGFVQDNTKVFVTTIRPRSSSVTEIPPIPFSFFDPKKEAFETVYSQPIPLTVNKSETLSLDSIVSGSNSPGDPSGSAKTDLAASPTGPDFENNFSLDLLSNRQSGQLIDWKLFAIVPPLVWLTLLLVRSLIGLRGLLPNFRSAEARAISRVQAAETETDLQNALVELVADRTRQSVESSQQAAGALRVLGLSTEANEYESFIARLDRDRLPATIQTVQNDSSVNFQTRKQDAIELVRKLNSAIVGLKKSTIKSKRQRKSPLSKTTASILFVVLMCAQGFAAQSDGSQGQAVGSIGQSAQPLTKKQLENIFEQANEAYRNACESAKSDSAESKVGFANAAKQYQAIADQGIRNCDLYINLANAQWQGSQPGEAIANYHRAKRCDPSSRKADANLKFAQTQIDLRSQTKSDRAEKIEDLPLAKTALYWLQVPVRVMGQNAIMILFAGCSVVFWTLIALRTCWVRFSIAKWACVPLLVMLVTGAFLFASDFQNTSIAVAVVDQLDVRSGDGDEFEISCKFEPALGQQLSVLSQRGNWLQVSIPASSSTSRQTGWVHRSQVEAIMDSEAL